MAHGSGLLFHQLIAIIRAAGVAQYFCAIIKAAVGVIHHAAGNVLREVAGIPFRDSLQHAFCEDACRAGRDGLHDIDDGNTEAAELAFIDGGILPVASEAVHLPGKDRVESAGRGIRDHGLKLAAGGGVLETGPGMIRVFMHEGVAFAFRVGADVRELLINGHVALARGGIAGIGYGGTRRTRNCFLLHMLTIWQKDLPAKQAGLHHILLL